MAVDMRHVCLVTLQSLIKFAVAESKRGRLPPDVAVQEMMTAPAARRPEPEPLPPASEPVSPERFTVTPQETLDYQKAEILKQMNALEIHLSQGCKIMGKPCDCCLKHGMLLLGLAEETVPIAGRAGESPQLYQDIAGWTAQNLVKMKHEGGAVDDMPRLAAEVGGLRKRLTA